jgi:hypothetical protein
MADQQAWRMVLESARAVERVPELMGIGPHLMVTARRRPRGAGRAVPGRAVPGRAAPGARR